MIVLWLGAWMFQANAAQEAAGSFVFSEELLKMRDPFLAPLHEPVRLEEKGDLEQYSVRDYQLIGVLTGPDRIRAVVSDPLGKIHFVKKTMKLGSLGGVVVQILPDSLTVRERRMSMTGQSEKTDTVLLLKKVKKD